VLPEREGQDPPGSRSDQKQVLVVSRMAEDRFCVVYPRLWGQYHVTVSLH